jgi:hypothetical protein
LDALTEVWPTGVAAEVVGMPLRDHVIVIRAGGYTSLLDLGVLDTE